jgi:hypothetical protein
MPIIRPMQPMVGTIKVKNINIWQRFLMKGVAYPLDSQPLRLRVRSEDRTVHLRENKRIPKCHDVR